MSTPSLHVAELVDASATPTCALLRRTRTHALLSCRTMQMRGTEVENRLTLFNGKLTTLLFSSACRHCEMASIMLERGRKGGKRVPVAGAQENKFIVTR